MKKFVAVLFAVLMVALCVSALAANSIDSGALTGPADTGDNTLSGQVTAADQKPSSDIVAECVNAADPSVEENNKTYALIEVLDLNLAGSKESEVDMTLKTITPLTKNDNILTYFGAYMGAKDQPFDKAQLVLTSVKHQVNDDGSLSIHLDGDAMANAANATATVLNVYKAE